MTVEKFRQWVVILFVVSIVTVWVGMGIKACRIGGYHSEKEQSSMARKQMPRRGTIPTRRTRRPTTEKPKMPAKPVKTAK